MGGRIINKVSRDLKYPTEFDTLPGRKYFTFKNFEVIYGYFMDTFGFYVQILILSGFMRRMMASISVNHGSSVSRKRFKC